MSIDERKFEDETFGSGTFGASEEPGEDIEFRLGWDIQPGSYLHINVGALPQGDA